MNKYKEKLERKILEELETECSMILSELRDRLISGMYEIDLRGNTVCINCHEYIYHADMDGLEVYAGYDGSWLETLYPENIVAIYALFRALAHEISDDGESIPFEATHVTTSYSLTQMDDVTFLEHLEKNPSFVLEHAFERVMSLSKGMWKGLWVEIDYFSKGQYIKDVYANHRDKVGTEAFLHALRGYVVRYSLGADLEEVEKIYHLIEKK